MQSVSLIIIAYCFVHFLNTPPTVLAWHHGLACYDTTVNITTVNAANQTAQRWDAWMSIGAVHPWQPQQWQKITPAPPNTYDSNHNKRFMSFQDARVYNNCAACLKTYVYYNLVDDDDDSAAGGYVQWQCLTLKAAHVQSASSCSSSVKLSTDADGNMYKKTCMCCSNRCNDDDFCTDKDKVLKKFVTNFTLSYRVNTCDYRQPWGFLVQVMAKFF